MPAVRCSWAGIGSAPESCSPDSEVGSSTRASGFPAAWIISRSATSSGTAAPAASVSSSRAASAVSGASARAGTPSGANVRPSLSRAANTTATRSAPSLRTATSTASAVAWSSHCASSMTQSTVASSAASVSTDRVASAARNGSTVTSSASPNAALSARACGAGSRSRMPSTGRRSRCSAANGSGASDSTPWARSTCTWSPAVATRSSSRADFPTPGSPCRSRVPACPWRAPSRSVASCARSSSRPCSTPVTLRVRSAVGRGVVRLRSR